MPLSISVGEVRDFTGRASINEGNAVTQGGSLMVISALGKLGPSIRLHERFDPRIGELELIYTDRRQLGDGRTYIIPEGNRERRVPWVPYMGGSILRSDYYIVGGITELNYTVQSGGVEFAVNGVGPSARSFSVNIAADLRIVDTRSLVVLHTVSLQKQVVGHEINAGVFRFFGSRLFDINIGTRNLEPIQLAVRTVLELGAIELVEAVSHVPARDCLDEGVRDGAVSSAYDSRFWRGPLPAPAPEPPRGAEYAPVQVRPDAPAVVPPTSQAPAPSSTPPSPPVAAASSNNALQRLFMGVGSLPTVPAVVPDSTPPALVPGEAAPLPAPESNPGSAPVSAPEGGASPGSRSESQGSGDNPATAGSAAPSSDGSVSGAPSREEGAAPLDADARLDLTDGNQPSVARRRRVM